MSSLSALATSLNSLKSATDAAFAAVLAPDQPSGPQVLADFSFPPSSPLIGIKPFCFFLSPVCPGASRHSELVFPLLHGSPAAPSPSGIGC